MDTSTLLIYLDDYHLDDPLYVQRMGRMLGRLRRRPRCLLVHGGGERVERMLEAEGRFPERHNGIIEPHDAAEATLIERAIRQVNHQIAGMLTDEMVHAVGFQGGDRGLLCYEGSGGVQARRVRWLGDLVGRGAVPVVSTLVRSGATDALREAPLSSTALALAQALEDVTLVFLTRTDQPGVLVDGTVCPTRKLADVPPGLLPNKAPVEAALEAGVRVLLSSATGLFGAEKVQGSMVHTGKTA